MTNEEFIRRLKRARRLALTGYKNEFRIGCACAEAGVIWRSPIREPNATISSDPIEYLNTHGNTEANVRAVFDNSIKALGGKP